MSSKWTFSEKWVSTKYSPRLFCSFRRCSPRAATWPRKIRSAWKCPNAAPSTRSFWRSRSAWDRASTRGKSSPEWPIRRPGTTPSSTWPRTTGRSRTNSWKDIRRVPWTKRNPCSGFITINSPTTTSFCWPTDLWCTDSCIRRTARKPDSTCIPSPSTVSTPWSSRTTSAAPHRIKATTSSSSLTFAWEPRSAWRSSSTRTSTRSGCRCP